MSDLISRQAAIDALYHVDEYNGRSVEAIRNLPSAQPGWTTDVNNILAYLDGTVHPLVSPENWNVYSELYDMVSGLLKPWEGKQDGEG